MSDLISSAEKQSGELDRLAARARADIAYVDTPAREWPPVSPSADGLDVFNVVVVGAGLNGLATAFRLMRQRIGNILVIDEAQAGREGPWITFARMRTLRTTKDMVGPDLGFPSLSFPAWYVASFGDAAWADLDKAPNGVWMDYLNWFRETSGIPVENNVRLNRIEPGPFGLTLRLSGRADIHAKQVVLATGVLGAGGGAVPAFISDLPREKWAHSADEIDFGALKGKTVAVVGAGASAFDNAASALEAGAAKVVLLARRDQLEQPDVKSAMHFAGCLNHYGDLSDDQRIRLVNALNAVAVPPPLSAVDRCEAHGDRFSFRLRSPVLGIDDEGTHLSVRIPDETITADFVIAATGFASRVDQRPELGDLAGAIELWKDRFAETVDKSGLGFLPYLGRSFEYRSKQPALSDALSRIRELGFSSMASQGPVCTGLGGIKFGAPSAVEGISRALFLEIAEEVVTKVEGVAAIAPPVNELQFV